MRVGVLTGGGDCPGLNAVIRGVTKALHRENCEVVGILDAFLGLIQRRVRILDDASVSGILQRGGTVLGSSNRDNPFDFDGMIDGVHVRGDVSDRVPANAKALGLDAIVVIGGDGTQRLAHRFSKAGLRVVGVPKTIDNDLMATDCTFGFDSACQVVSDALDRLHTTADSHHRIMFLETMGRDSGFLALHGGIAGGGDVILLPEIPFDLDVVAGALQARIDVGKLSSLVVVAEGAKPVAGQQVYIEGRRLGGVAQTVAGQVGKLLGLDCRVTVLGHLQRGGSPTAFDRVLGTRFGTEAARLVVEGRFDHMVALRGEHIVAVPLEEAISGIRQVDPKGEAVRSAEAVGTSFGWAVST